MLFWSMGMGLLKELTAALVTRAMEAEATDHLGGYEAGRMSQLEEHRVGVVFGERTTTQAWRETGYETCAYVWRRAWD